MKRPQWPQVMMCGGWAHVTVYASVHLVNFGGVGGIMPPMWAFQPNL